MKRQSNFELLRIVAMLMVLTVHADFWSLGAPSKLQIAADPINAIARISFESAAIVCVDLFVMISGWFGIRASLKGVCNLLFQCLWFAAIAVGYLAVTIDRPVLTDLLPRLLLIKSTSWFITAYLGLYIISPALNALIEKSSRRQLELFLVGFFAFQSFFGWVGHSQSLNHGYSAFSFMGLYLLARYLRLYGASLTRYGLRIYAASTLATLTLCFTVIFVGYTDLTMAYSSPFVICGAAGLILFCAAHPLPYLRTVNLLAASAFAVFLLHMSADAGAPTYYDLMRRIYADYSGAACLGLMAAAIAATYLLAFLLDQPRRALWHLLTTVTLSPRRLFQKFTR